MKQPTSTNKTTLYTIAIFLFLAFTACKNKVQPPVPPPPPAPPVVVVDPPVAPTPPAPPAEVDPPHAEVPPTVEKMFKGQATYYADHYHGKKTKTEEIYDKTKYTCAIRQNAISVKMGSILEVYSIKRKKKVKVKVNDIMSPRAKAVIDLSRIAAEDIGLLIDGRTDVTIRLISEPE